MRINVPAFLRPSKSPRSETHVGEEAARERRKPSSESGAKQREERGGDRIRLISI